MILTIDFGTSVTKVGLWGDEGLVALARSELATTYPQVGWTEQDTTSTAPKAAGAWARASAQAMTSDVHQRSGSCSVQPTWG